MKTRDGETLLYMYIILHDFFAYIINFLVLRFFRYYIIVPTHNFIVVYCILNDQTFYL